MGDISELRGLITVATFLGVLVLLITWLPVQFYSVGETRRVATPEFEGIDIRSFVDTANSPMNRTGGGYSVVDANWYYVNIDDGTGDFGGYDLDMWYKVNGSTPYEINHEHLYTDWLIFTFSHYMTHYDKSGIDRGETLTVEEIEANSDDNQTSHFTIKGDHFSAKAIYNYNSTKWSNFTQAWDNQELYVFHGINFDQVSTGYSAFDLIALLLFFQMPNMNIYVNALIAIPIWIAIAYVVFILVLRAIGAIFGGGA